MHECTSHCGNLPSTSSMMTVAASGSNVTLGSVVVRVTLRNSESSTRRSSRMTIITIFVTAVTAALPNVRSVVSGV